MKILHTSDWHLGKYLNNISRHSEQVEVLNEIVEIAENENINVVVISGDLFDTFNPPVESVDLFYRTLKKLSQNGKRAVVAIAGNHDSPDRVEAPDPLARECGIIFAGYPNTKVPIFKLESGLAVEHSCEGFFCLTLPGITEKLRVLLTPYANEYRLKSYLGAENQEQELRNVLAKSWEKTASTFCDSEGVNIMISHLMFIKAGETIPEEPDDEKPILHVGGAQIVYAENIPPQIQYTALGHLHRRQYVRNGNSPVIYSGSPLAYSFSEANQQKFVQIVEVFPGKPANVSSRELVSGRKLLRKRAETVEEAVSWLLENQHALIELTMVTDNFLTSHDRKRLFNVHDGIVSIIPEVRNLNLINSNSHKNIDLTKDMNGLFSEYFLHTKGQLPDDCMLSLFKEVLSEENSL